MLDMVTGGAGVYSNCGCYWRRGSTGAYSHCGCCYGEGGTGASLWMLLWGAGHIPAVDCLAVEGTGAYSHCGCYWRGGTRASL